MQSHILLALLICSGLAIGSPADPVGRIQSLKRNEAGAQDWFSDLIEELLGMIAEEFLKLIDYTVRQLSPLIFDAITKLKEAIEEADISSGLKFQFTQILDAFHAESVEIIQPIQEYLNILIPAIQAQNDNDDKDMRMPLSDLIRALLGMSLEDLLREIYEALSKMAILLDDTITKLLGLVSQISGEESKVIEGIINGSLEDAGTLVAPILEMLDDVLLG